MLLVFNDRGWSVATSSWSVASKGDDAITVCYQWGADGISFFDSATGIARCTFAITMVQFMRRVAEGKANGGVIDLRDVKG